MSEKSNTARIEKMATWASRIEKTLDELHRGLVITTNTGADAISARLGTLLDGRQQRGEDYHNGLARRGELKVTILECKEDMTTLEARAMLDVSVAVDEKGKLLYGSDDKRKAAVKVQLTNEETYQSLRTAKHTAERELAHVGAMIASLEAEAGEYKRAVDVLTAQLNNLTARVA